MRVLPVSTATQHGACFKVTAYCCDLPQMPNFADLIVEDGGVFATKSEKPPFAVEELKIILFWRNSRKTGRRRSTDSYERDFKDISDAKFVANFRILCVCVLYKTRRFSRLS